MSWTRLSHLRGSGLTPGQSTKTLPASRLRRKGRKKQEKNPKQTTDRTPNQMVKAKLNRQNHTKKHEKKTNNNNKIETVRTLGQMVKANLKRQNHTKKHTYTHSKKEKKRKKIFF